LISPKSLEYSMGANCVAVMYSLRKASGLPALPSAQLMR
jgi:hypothetical protein